MAQQSTSLPSRRDFLAGGLAAAALAGVGALARRADGQAQRPNILWLTCEDMSPRLGCYGDPVAHTPALDALAAESVRYTHCFSVAGVCAPSRSCIATGVYPTTLGTHLMRCRAHLPESVKCFSESLREAGYWCTNAHKEDYQFATPPTAWDATGSYNKQQAHWRHRPEASQPFFSVINNTVTHESVHRDDETYRNRVKDLPAERRCDPAAVAVPPYYPDTPTVRADIAHQYDVDSRMDMWVADELAALEAAGLADDTVVFFYSDHGDGLPRGKRWLYDSGLRVPLLVRIPERWRLAGQGQPGSVTDELVSFLDLAPTVLNLCGLPPAPVMQGRAFLGANLTPPRRYVHAARDRHDERVDQVRAVRDQRFKYLRNYRWEEPYLPWQSYAESVGVRRELRRLHEAGELPPAAERLFSQPRPPEELYDTAADPHEVNNLAADPAYAAELARLRAEHEAWTAATGDLGYLPEGELLKRREAAGSEYAVAQSDLPARCRAAALSSERGVEALDDLLALATHADAELRWWGVTGLRRLGDGSEATRRALLRCLTDPSGEVRCAAAVALHRLGDAVHPRPVLVAMLLGGENTAVRHAAALGLEDLAGDAAPALQALRRVSQRRDGDYARRVAERLQQVLTGEVAP